MNPWSILVATLLAFGASAVYYMFFAKQRAKLSPAAAHAGRPSAGKLLLEVLRTLALAFVVAYLVGAINITNESGAFVLALLLWIGFPVMLLTGSVMYEKVPEKLAAIHAGDWLVKLLIMTAILANWR